MPPFTLRAADSATLAELVARFRLDAHEGGKAMNPARRLPARARALALS